jgi:ribose 1,5-bisphosphokinase PhnN
MINGPFGVGKSTVARLLRERLDGSIIYDPEWAGIAMMRLSRVIGRGNGVDDFQDIALWRKLTVKGIRLFAWKASGAVIVPMTFSRRDYFDEIIDGIQRFDSDVQTFCLKASESVIRDRLNKRGDKTEGPGSEWIERRNIECIDAQLDPHFGKPVETETRNAAEVAEYILELLNAPSPGN